MLSGGLVTWQVLFAGPCRQDRRDKEKDKRAKGQSSHQEWKTEAEMVLRQQYD